MMHLSLLILVLASLLTDADSADWISATEEVQYACSGEDVTIGWRFVLSPEERLDDIQWHFEGSSHEMIAVFADGHFLPLPAFYGRVQEHDNAGLVLSNVRAADSGNYSVLVNLHNDSGVFAQLHQSIFIQIGDTLMTQDGFLHVTELPEAVLDSSTSQWAVRLECGTFTHRTEPPFQVEWTTPGVQVLASSRYRSDHFELLLHSPVEGGNYTCRIPLQSFAAACLHANQTEHGQATIYVDKVIASLAILESENKYLKEQLQQFICPIISSQTTTQQVTTNAVTTQTINVTSTTYLPISSQTTTLPSTTRQTTSIQSTTP